jgi:hypothetical protein
MFSCWRASWIFQCFYVSIEHLHHFSRPLESYEGHYCRWHHLCFLLNLCFHLCHGSLMQHMKNTPVMFGLLVFALRFPLVSYSHTHRPVGRARPTGLSSDRLGWLKTEETDSSFATAPGASQRPQQNFAPSMRFRPGEPPPRHPPWCLTVRSHGELRETPNTWFEPKAFRTRGTERKRLT